MAPDALGPVAGSLMLYEVVLTNPLVLLTRAPGRTEHLVADLGRIHIGNTFKREDANATALGRWKEHVQVRMTKMTVTSGQDDFRMLEDVKVSLSLGWDAGFESHLLNDPMRVHCDISRIDVRLCERHYALLSAVWDENLVRLTDAPPPPPPPQHHAMGGGLSGAMDPLARSEGALPLPMGSPGGVVHAMARSDVLPPRSGGAFGGDQVPAHLRASSMYGTGSVGAGAGAGGGASRRADVDLTAGGAPPPAAASMDMLVTLGRVSLTLVHAVDGLEARMRPNPPRRPAVIASTPIAKFSLGTLRFKLEFDEDGPSNVDVSVVSLTVRDLRPHRNRHYEEIVVPRVDIDREEQAAAHRQHENPHYGDDEGADTSERAAWGASGMAGDGEGAGPNASTARRRSTAAWDNPTLPEHLFLHVTFHARGAPNDESGSQATDLTHLPGYYAEDERNDVLDGQPVVDIECNAPRFFVVPSAVAAIHAFAAASLQMAALNVPVVAAPEESLLPGSLAAAGSAVDAASVAGTNAYVGWQLAMVCPSHRLTFVCVVCCVMVCPARRTTSTRGRKDLAAPLVHYPLKAVALSSYPQHPRPCQPMMWLLR